MDRQETQALWLCAVTCIPRAGCSQTSTCLSVLILATPRNSCPGADIQQLQCDHCLHTDLKQYLVGICTTSSAYLHEQRRTKKEHKALFINIFQTNSQCFLIPECISWRYRTINVWQSQQALPIYTMDCGYFRSLSVASAPSTASQIYNRKQLPVKGFLNTPKLWQPLCHHYIN